MFRLIYKVFIIFSLVSCSSMEFLSIPIPVDSKINLKLNKKYSDDFNYKNKSKQFYSKWSDSYVNNWKGPGLTHFSKDHSRIKNGKLEILASRKPPNKVFCGVISSKTPILYPTYIEIKMKISGLKLSSNFWMISKDQVNEIDINETYGNEPEQGREMSTNYHIFRRDPFKDLTPKNNKHARAIGEPMLKEGYHRFGCYWKDAFTAFFYLDGKLIREMRINDPRELSVGFNQPMYLVIDTEDHAWRSNKGVIASDIELKDKTQNTMLVDWVRVYKLK